MSINDQAAKTSSLLCPACKVDLIMTERQSIEVDYCPRCRGVWLDRGELDKIIERVTTQPTENRQPPPGYPQQQGPEYHPQASKGHHGGHGYGGQGYGHRRKSWIQEIFD